jgi:signal transduction histidine kinase
MNISPLQHRDGKLSAALADERLVVAFPAVFVLDAGGRSIDANAAASDVAPGGDGTDDLLRALLESGGLSWSEAAPDTSAAVQAGGVEGVATVVEHDGERVVVLYVRDAAGAPVARHLAEQVRLYEAVLASGPIFVHVYDRDMNSRWSTASLRPELGYEPQQPMSAEENYAFVHPDDVPTLRMDRRLIETGEPPPPRRIRVRDAQGAWRWLALLSVDLLDDPDVGSIVIHSWDVTDEVEREEEIDAARRRLVALIDTLDEAVAVINDGVIVYANARLSELFPALGPHDQVIGRRTADVQEAVAASMADPQDFLETTRGTIATGAPVRGRMVETEDGRTLDQHFLPIRVGDRETSRLWVTRDVTAQLELERRQARLLELERDARQRVEEQNRLLRELDDLKTAFVATVSHELRTPLSALTSYLELLLDDPTGALEDDQRQIAAAAKRGADRLARLVDDLLVLAQVQSRSLRIDRGSVDVPHVVLEAVEEVRRGLDREIDLTAEVAGGPQVTGDRARLMQILVNLISNAAKFADGRVVCIAQPSGAAWTVEVLDDGPGVPPEELQQLFEPFYRGRDAVRGRRPGTGLGLPISAQLAELLGWRLTLDNREEGGAVARLTLPVDAQEERS